MIRLFLLTLSADITVVENPDGTLTVTTLTEGTDTLTDVETLVDGNGDIIFTTLTTPPSASATVVDSFDPSTSVADSTADPVLDALPPVETLADDSGLA